MQRKFSFAPGEYYHLYSRGTEKRTIFLDYGDYLRFLVLLHVANFHQAVHLSDYQSEPLPRRQAGFPITMLWSRSFGDKLVDVGAYCLMPNHFHLLVREKKDNGIPQFMKKLLTGYSMYFNKKRVRTGKLFEGAFKANHVDNDEYLKYLFAYIHLNPVKSLNSKDWEEKIIRNKPTAQSYLDQYEYSSYPYYSGRVRPSDSILNPSAFPKYFIQPKEFSDFIKDWVSYSVNKDSP